jgi:hypothetical protein
METFVRKPGRTAGPSTALRSGRDDKWWVVTFIRGRQIGWTEKTQQVPSLTSREKSIKSQPQG